MGAKNANFEILSGRFSKHLSSFKSYLKNQAAAFESEIRTQAAECVKPQGKYLRPMLVFASAPSLKSSDKSLLNRAACVELIHLASLIHDDVIDNASLRRNSETIYKRYGARTAILLGDAIFAHAMELAFKEKDESVWRKSVQAVKTLCEGEVRQSLSQKKEPDMARYISVIEGKTASLFEYACFMGASLEDGSKSAWTKAAMQAGMCLGRAYQMYDDVCDWLMSESESGKTAGTDLISEKYTLPIIVLLEKLPKKQSREISKDLSSCNVENLATLMRRENVISECAKLFDSEISKARKLLVKFPKKNENLLKFCDETAALMPHSWLE